MTRSSRRVVAIVGATATGKTDVGEAVAEQLGGEVICADSRQVFRELEIGTGKPTPEARAARPHHLFDALGVGDRAGAGGYGRVAGAECERVLERGHTPIVVGGSGLYLESLVRGLAATPPHDPDVRARLGAEVAACGSEAMYRRLTELDPDTAARLEPGDARRITRALEVLEVSGHPLSWWHRERPGIPLDVDWRIVELRASPPSLDARIERRTRAMFAGGLVEETNALVTQGLEPALRALAAVGYDECLELLRGRLSREAAEERTRLRTRQLAKRQRTWFRHRIEALRLDVDEGGGGPLVSRVMEEARRQSWAT